MEVIFDTPDLRPVLSPAMKTTLSVIGLIADTLIETNNCMKKRLEDGAEETSTPEQVMKQAGLNIPTLEEALTKLMGGSDEAKQAAAMVVNTPDPAKLLQTFASTYGFGVPPKRGPVVTPPAPATEAPPAAHPTAQEPAQTAGPAPFRPEFTRAARPTADAATPSPTMPALAPFRPDFTREACSAMTPAPRTAVPGTRLTLHHLVTRQLDRVRQQQHTHEHTVDGRLARLDAEVTSLRAELRLLREPTPAQPNEQPPAEAPIATDSPAPTKAPTATDSPAPAEAPTANDEPVASASVNNTATAPTPSSDRELELPPAATPEEVVEAVELIDEYAQEAEAANQRQLAQIDAMERDVAYLRAEVRREREARETTPAHA